MTCRPVIFVSHELPDMRVAFRIGDATSENIENSQNVTPHLTLIRPDRCLGECADLWKRQMSLDLSRRTLAVSGAAPAMGQHAPNNRTAL